MFSYLQHDHKLAQFHRARRSRNLLACVCHSLSYQNTFYRMRAHSTVREHILSYENTFSLTRASVDREICLHVCVTFYRMRTHSLSLLARSSEREHILSYENTFSLTRSRNLLACVCHSRELERMRSHTIECVLIR